MIFDIYEQTDLYTIAGCKRQATLVAWLDANHIPYMRNVKDQIIAHKTAVDLGLGVTVGTEQDTDKVKLWLGGEHAAEKETGREPQPA